MELISSHNCIQSCGIDDFRPYEKSNTLISWRIFPVSDTVTNA